MSDFLIYQIKTSVRVRVWQDIAGHGHCVASKDLWSDSKMQLCAGYCSFVFNTDREGGMLCSAPFHGSTSSSLLTFYSQVYFSPHFIGEKFEA